MITADPGRITVKQGTLLELTVKGDELGNLSLMDQVEPIERESPAIFNVLADTPGEYPIAMVDEGRDVGDARRQEDELGASPRRAAWASCPGWYSPVPSHHGHVDGLRRAAEAGDDLAGTAAGGAALRIVGVGRRFAPAEAG